MIYFFVIFKIFYKILYIFWCSYLQRIMTMILNDFASTRCKVYLCFMVIPTALIRKMEFTVDFLSFLQFFEILWFFCKNLQCLFILSNKTFWMIILLTLKNHPQNSVKYQELQKKNTKIPKYQKNYQKYQKFQNF